MPSKRLNKQASSTINGLPMGEWYGEYDDANPEQSFRQRTAEAEARIEELIKLIPSPFCKPGRCQICDARRKAKRGRS